MIHMMGLVGLAFMRMFLTERSVAGRAFEKHRATERKTSMASFASFEDSTLIQYALAGETECFNALTNRHLPAVRRRIYTIAPKTVDPEDLLQEVLLKVWLHLSTFRSQSSFR